MVEERREEKRGEKTEGRPPSGLIKSITFSSLLDLARDSPACSFPPFSLLFPLFSFLQPLTPNSHNCSFFPPSSLLVLRSPASFPTVLSSWPAQLQRLFTLILILLPAASDSRRKPLPPLPSPSSSSSRCFEPFSLPRRPRLSRTPLTLSSSTSSLNNCVPGGVTFSSSRPATHSTKGC